MCPGRQDAHEFHERHRVEADGDAISEEGYKKTIEKDGVYEGVKIRPEKDVIRLQKGGTGRSSGRRWNPRPSLPSA